MDLSLSSEQEQLLEVVASLLEKHCTSDHVRRAEPLGFDPALWRRVVELGLMDIGRPERAGGVGAGLLDVALVAEACGRALAPVPFVEAPVAARAVAAASGGEPPPDGAVLSIAPMPAVDGVARLVPYGAVAERVLALDGDRLVLVEHQAPGVSPANLGCTALADVPLRGPGVEVLVSGDEARARYQQALREWRLLMAAALAGLARGALDLAVAYVKERHQFGVPIGSFQAVAHRLADVATEVDGATLLWQEAAWAQDVGEDSALSLSYMSFAFSSEVAERAAAASLHFHGGYGFMLEYDIQLFVRRAKAWPLSCGPRAATLNALADVLYGQEGG